VDSRVLEIVFYLMDHFQEPDDQASSISEFSSDLKSLGYSDEEISSAYGWVLDHLSAAGESLYSSFDGQIGSSRILTDQERARMTSDAYGFLIKLSNMGFLSGEQFEKILDRLGIVGSRMVTRDQVKLIASAVLFTQQDQLDSILMADGELDLTTQIN
jgi:uncharacterized protein Smg (DUF494 family)